VRSEKKVERRLNTKDTKYTKGKRERGKGKYHFQGFLKVGNEPAN
jgi:hypothetical protein